MAYAYLRAVPAATVVSGIREWRWSGGPQTGRDAHHASSVSSEADMGLASKISTGLNDRSARLAGIGLMLAGIWAFSFGDALGKYIVASYPVGQLLFLRAVASLALLSPLIWRSRHEFMRLERPGLHLLRVVLSTLEVAAFFVAVMY